MTRLKAHCRACCNIEAMPISGLTIKIECWIGFEKMIMAAHLHRTVAGVGYA